MQKRAFTAPSGPGSGEVAARGAAAACLVVAATVPSLFDARAERAFDETKVILLRSLAAFGAGALLIWVVENVPGWSRFVSRIRHATTILAAAAVLAAAYVSATVLSIAPRIAWEGAYIRRQGTLTLLSYVLFFVTAVLFERTQVQVRQFLLALLLASVFPTAYALSQHAGLDLTVWHNPAPMRVTSTAGNAIFLGGYLIMVWPITIGEIVRFCRQWFTTHHAGGRLTLVEFATLSSLVLLAAAQIAAIVFTGSVGVWVALVAEILVFVGVLLGQMFRVRTRIAVIAIALVGTGVLGTLATVRRPIEGVTASKLSRVFGGSSRSGEVRLLLWRRGVDLLREKPGRALVGYGPDMIRLTLGRYDPAAVRKIEGPATADRSHNGVLDTILTVGLVGLLAHTLLLAALTLHALRALGLVTSTKQAASLGLSVVLSFLVCLVLAYSVDRRAGLLPLGWGGGLVAGLLLFLLLRGVLSRQVLPWDAVTMPQAALLAAVVGHYVETQTGIGTATSELYFWLFAGMMAAAPTSSSNSTITAAEDPMLSTGVPQSNAIVIGVTTGLLLAIMTFDFADRLVERSSALPLFGLFVAVLLVMSVALRSRADIEVSVRTIATSRRQARRVFLIACVGLWLTFLTVSTVWMRFHSDGIDQAGAEAARVTEQGVGLLVGLFATVFTACAVLAVSRDAPPGFKREVRTDRSRHSVVSAAFVTSVVLLTVPWNLDALRADELSRMGTAFMSAGQWSQAEWFFTRAFFLQPARDVYSARLGEVLLTAFRRGPHAQMARLENARHAYLMARQINPVEPDYLLQLAAIESLWASAERRTDERRRHLDEASRYLAVSAQLAPRDPVVWNEWGKVRLRDGDFSDGAGMFERSLALDDTSPDSHLLYADALAGAGRYEAALREYETAQTLGLANPLPAISGKALALVRLNRLAEAIDANTEALKIAPEDYISRKNLAMLYEEVGDIGRALSFAIEAAAVADASAKPAIEALVGELRAKLRGDKEMSDKSSDRKR